MEISTRVPKRDGLNSVDKLPFPDVKCVLSARWPLCRPNGPHLSSHRQAIAFLPIAKLQWNQGSVVLIVTWIAVRGMSSFWELAVPSLRNSSKYLRAQYSLFCRFVALSDERHNLNSTLNSSRTRNKTLYILNILWGTTILVAQRI